MLYFEKNLKKKSEKRVNFLNRCGDQHQILADVNWTYSECTVQILSKSLHMGPRYSRSKIFSFFWKAKFGLNGKYLSNHTTNLILTLGPFNGAFGQSVCKSWRKSAQYFGRYGPTKWLTKQKRAMLCHFFDNFQTHQNFFVPLLGVAPKMNWLTCLYLK